jgi:hypothetical protein
MELWSLALSLKKEKVSEGLNRVMHVNDLRAFIKREAQALEKQVPPESNLEEAAAMYLKLGDVKQFCEIKVALNQWEIAIAMAPARSMAYWNELCKRYAKHLVSQSQPRAVEFLLVVCIYI